jgi:hypothetical protein
MDPTHYVDFSFGETEEVDQNNKIIKSHMIKNQSHDTK